MATIDLGKIKFNWREQYDASTAYVPDDCVYYTDGSVVSSYICKTASTGNAPSSGGTLHASWDYLAKGQASSPTTTQGDIIVRGASADQRLAIGTAGQALKVNGAANGLEYGNAAGMTLLYQHNSTGGTAENLEAGILTNEVSGSGTAYVRQSVTFGAISIGSVSNSGNVTFPTATAGYGTVTHVAVMDTNSTSDSAGAGNVLYYGALSTAREILTDDTFQITAGNLTISLA